MFGENVRFADAAKFPPELKISCVSLPGGATVIVEIVPKSFAVAVIIFPRKSSLLILFPVPTINPSSNMVIPVIIPAGATCQYLSYTVPPSKDTN